MCEEMPVSGRVLGHRGVVIIEHCTGGRYVRVALTVESGYDPRVVFDSRASTGDRVAGHAGHADRWIDLGVPAPQN